MSVKYCYHECGSISFYIENCACFTLGGILPIRVRLYNSASTMICALRARCSITMVILFHGLSISLYRFMSGVGCRHLSANRIFG